MHDYDELDTSAALDEETVVCRETTQRPERAPSGQS